MADTKSFLAVSTLALLTLGPWNDDWGFRMLCVCYGNVLVKYSLSRKFLFTGRKYQLRLGWKGQWMNVQQNVSRVHSLWMMGPSDLSHVCQLKGLVCWTFPLSAHFSILLAQHHENFRLTVYIKTGYNHTLLYGVKTMEQSHGRRKEMRITQMVFRMENLCDKTSKKRCRHVCEDNIKINIWETWCVQWFVLNVCSSKK